MAMVPEHPTHTIRRVTTTQGSSVDISSMQEYRVRWGPQFSYPDFSFTSQMFLEKLLMCYGLYYLTDHDRRLQDYENLLAEYLREEQEVAKIEADIKV